MSINTHNLIIDFGKHKGERWTRVPKSYLVWLINQPIDCPEENPEFIENKKIARAELDRRGTTITKKIELSPHAIDTASLRLRKVWHKTKKKNEGLYTWLSRVAVEATTTVEDKPDRIKHLGITFVFKWGTEFPILKTVIKRH